MTVSLHAVVNVEPGWLYNFFWNLPGTRSLLLPFLEDAPADNVPSVTSSRV